MDGEKERMDREANTLITSGTAYVSTLVAVDKVEPVYHY